MTKHHRVLTAAASSALAAAIAIPALSSAQSGGTDIVVREKVQSVHIDHQSSRNKGDRLATGDRVQTRQGLYDESGKSIGTLFTDCVNMGKSAQIFQATMLCTVSYRLADGQLNAFGALRLSSKPSTQSAPLIGSGAYRGKHGEVTSAPPVKGYDTVDVLHIDA